MAEIILSSSRSHPLGGQAYASVIFLESHPLMYAPRQVSKDHMGYISNSQSKKQENLQTSDVCFIALLI